MECLKKALAPLQLYCGKTSKEHQKEAAKPIFSKKKGLAAYQPPTPKCSSKNANYFATATATPEKHRSAEDCIQPAPFLRLMLGGAVIAANHHAGDEPLRHLLCGGAAFGKNKSLKKGAGASGRLQNATPLRKE